jgi:excisionase family DNA binding protein
MKTVTAKEAAFRLNKSTDTIYRWMRAGRLHGWQLGGARCSVMISVESVERVLLGARRV